MEVLVIVRQLEKVLTLAVQCNKPKVLPIVMQLIKSMPGLSVNLWTRLWKHSQGLLPVDKQLRHLSLSTQHLPTPKNTRKLRLCNLHLPPPFTSSDKEPHSTQPSKIPPMELRFHLKVL
jgi:hypothetical protein